MTHGATPRVVRGFTPSVLDRVHFPDTGLAIFGCA
jgi:hypothetical protein